MAGRQGDPVISRTRINQAVRLHYDAVVAGAGKDDIVTAHILYEIIPAKRMDDIVTGCTVKLVIAVGSQQCRVGQLQGTFQHRNQVERVTIGELNAGQGDAGQRSQYGRFQ